MRAIPYILFILVSSSCLNAQDIEKLGGDLTHAIPGRNGIQVTAPNVTDPNRTLKQLVGFSAFHKTLRRRDGLGPRFVNRSCGGCHIDNGKGRVGFGRGTSQMVVKVGLRGVNQDGPPRPVPGVGEQLQDRSLVGKKRRHKVRLRWRIKKGIYPDGTRYTLRRPNLRFRVKGIKRRKIASSLRMAPGLIGLGLLESIPESIIKAQSDPFDDNRDGISGQVQYVPNRRTGGFSVGRFGFTGSHPTLEQQTAAAAFFDMGVTTSLFAKDDKAPELSDQTLETLTLYQALAGVPFARNQGDPAVMRGKALFQQVGCNNCHSMTVTTESAGNPELDGQTIHPFTDLLLHHMGRGLADRFNEYSASGSEWRTTPLWGLGFLETVSGVEQRYLHDGRARTIEEAILWHGGEAAQSQRDFKALSASERMDLIAFLRSL